jgi:hypothetical protein
MVPQGTLNYMVAAQLAELSMLRQEYGMASGKRGKKKEKEKD